MKIITSFLSLLFINVLLFSQDPNILNRSDIDPALAPFYHGVASGDPLPDAVIIWTRLTTEDSIADVNWEVATDLDFNNIVKSGQFTTDATRDYTVKVDVTGLQSYTYYYYRFNYHGGCSVPGRTKTAPTGNVNNVRLGVVACSSYKDGFFNVYNHLAQRNDLDVILHLGDYIYEHGGGSGDHALDPPHEIITLDDYRLRYSHYRLDKDLRDLHQQYPFIVVWDDHESSNDSWEGGADGHDPNTEGTWEDRTSYATKAYDEWLPIRTVDESNLKKIYRTIDYGDLVKLYMLETRLLGRTEQGVGAQEDRTILGVEQRDWLLNELGNSTAKWNVLGQQVVMTDIPFVGTLNSDSWYGYPKDRDTIYDYVLDNNISNLVVLTGDVHTAWTSDLVTDTYDANTQSGSAGVEFVCNSVTAQGAGIPLPLSLIQGGAPNVKYLESELKGYLILDLKDTIAQGDFYEVNTILSETYTATYDGGNFTVDGTRYLQDNTSESTNLFTPADMANKDICVTAVKEHKSLMSIGVYPNPFYNKFTLQYYVEDLSQVDVNVFDLTGKMVYTETILPTNTGVNYAYITIENNLPKGAYTISLTQDELRYNRQLIKY